jgi:hypothetical protein
MTDERLKELEQIRDCTWCGRDDEACREIRQLQSALRGVPRDLINWMPPEERDVLYAKIKGHEAAIRRLQEEIDIITSGKDVLTEMNKRYEAVMRQAYEADDVYAYHAAKRAISALLELK